MPWDPLSDLLSLHDRLERGSRFEGAGWMPVVDVYETSDQYVVTAELPGVDRRDFTIDGRDGELSLRGRRPEAGVPSHAYVQVERGQGPFERRFVFAEPIGVDRIAAELQDGVLTIRVPKAARPDAKRITIT